MAVTFVTTIDRSLRPLLNEALDLFCTIGHRFSDADAEAILWSGLGVLEHILDAPRAQLPSDAYEALCGYHMELRGALESVREKLIDLDDARWIVEGIACDIRDAIDHVDARAFVTGLSIERRARLALDVTPVMGLAA